MKRARALGLLLALILASCRRSEEPLEKQNTTPSASAAAKPSAPPALLYLPDGGDSVLEGMRPSAALPPGAAGGRCPPDMVDVGGRFCIDRFEASLVDVRLGRDISPYFAPQRATVRSVLEAFTGSAPPGAPALPRPPDWELAEVFAPRAMARPRVVPNGYVSGVLAGDACRNAGKRLCKPEEWTTACRGERGSKFPYGDRYEAGACNVDREAHPAAVLHGDASKNHLDPRLNLVVGLAGPLLRRTGETARCRSEWGGDAVYDMVGNLDEWVDEAGGAFLGGFFSRATQNGCDARVSEHPPEYFDYSTGVRCCL